MEDVLYTTIKAIKALSPDLKFTLSAKFEADGSGAHGVDWDTFVVDESCAGMTIPTREQIDAKRIEIANAIPLARLRAERDRRIADTDWWVLPDRTPTEAQLAYRQALRDITDTYTSLDDVVWPLNPTEAV